MNRYTLTDNQHRDNDGTRRKAWHELRAEQQDLAKRMFLPLWPYEDFRYEIGRDGAMILSRKPANQC
jgi:hypothetical protein